MDSAGWVSAPTTIDGVGVGVGQGQGRRRVLTDPQLLRRLLHCCHQP